MIRTEYQNVVQAVVERAESEPTHISMIFIADDGGRQWITAGQFHDEAVVWARGLEAVGIGRSDVLITVLPHTPELLFSFWGGVYLGAVPSIFPSPSPRVDRAHFVTQIREMAEQVEARAVVTNGDWKDEIRAAVGDLGCMVLDVAEVTADIDGAEFDSAWLDWRPEDGAVLQFSSGTTGTKKGVLVKHRMLLNQVDVFIEFWDLKKDDVVVSWLPLNHDLGLFCGFLIPMVSGVVTVLMSPLHWIRDPKVFLWAVSEYHGTHSSMPNFGFTHLVRSVRESEIEGLDRSSWKQILNGAEPVRADTLDDFADRFSPYGLDPKALMPGYGMSENTAAIALKRFDDVLTVEWVDSRKLQDEGRAVTVPPLSAGALSLVASGRPVTGTELRVVDADGQALPESRVGEIQLRGASIFDGYYKLPRLSAEVLTDEGWFKTGDLGFVKDGRVFITGRLKDLIIVGGSNVHPEDLEGIADTIDGIYPGKAVAFGLYNQRLGTEGAAMVCEASRQLSDDEKLGIIKELRRRVASQMDVALADVRLVDKGWVIRSSSGKLARAANRERYLQDFGGQGTA